MATANPAEGLRRPMGVMKRITGWYLAMAVLFIVLGVFAIIEPVAAGLGVGMLVGLLLVFGGGGHIVAAFRAGDAKHVLLQMLIAVAYLAGGIYFLTHVFMATATLTLLLGGIILAEGVLEAISYLRLKSEGASLWLLLNGIITLVLGGMIWMHWPSSTVWAIGTIVGVNLLMTGITRLLFGLAVRKAIAHVAG
jgi:uncharacterized membrane protein HdeD (DUF308 family)